MADVAPDLPEFSIGDRLQKAREAAGITSTKRMAALLNEKLKPAKPWSHNTVGAWERGANQPRRMAEIIDAYAAICSEHGKDRGVRVTRGWLYGVESRQTRSDKSRAALSLASSRVKPVKSKSCGSPLLATV